MKKIFFIISFLFIFFKSAGAYEPKEGVLIGGLLGLGFAVDDNGLENSMIPNLGLEVGYQFSNKFDLLGRISFCGLTDENTSGLDLGIYPFLNFDIGTRYYFSSEQLSPYVFGALGFFYEGSNESTFIESTFGLHATIGGGFLYYLNEKNGLGLEGTYNYFATDPSAIQMILFNIIYKHTF